MGEDQEAQMEECLGMKGVVLPSKVLGLKGEDTLLGLLGLTL